MSIVVKNLKHEYSQGNDQVTAALKEVTITIEEGEFLGIIGHTGSGKTTFVQHLNGLLMPTDGTIFVDGVDLTQKGITKGNKKKSRPCFSISGKSII